MPKLLAATAKRGQQWRECEKVVRKTRRTAFGGGASADARGTVVAVGGAVSVAVVRTRRRASRRLHMLETVRAKLEPRKC
jgi:hypothetical protein